MGLELKVRNMWCEGSEWSLRTLFWNLTFSSPKLVWQIDSCYIHLRKSLWQDGKLVIANNIDSPSVSLITLCLRFRRILQHWCPICLCRIATNNNCRDWGCSQSQTRYVWSVSTGINFLQWSYWIVCSATICPFFAQYWVCSKETKTKLLFLSRFKSR